MSTPALLALEDGTVFKGRAFGHHGQAFGLLAANSAYSGFPELLTDPAYFGRFVCFTYPHIGNAGVAEEDLQSGKVHARAAIAREFCKTKSNWRSTETMESFLKRHKTPGIDGVDTRTLARLLAANGSLRAGVACGDVDGDELVDKVRSFKPPAASSREVATAKSYRWKSEGEAAADKRWKVRVYDLGVKTGLLRRLAAAGCEVEVVPSSCPAKDTLKAKVDGVVFSGGPGDPAAEDAAVKAAKGLIDKTPVWGVGLGAGVVAAAGARTEPDARGHFGGFPVGRPDEPTGEMTSQAVAFRIVPDSLEPARLETTHFNLGDKAVAGFASEERRIMGTLFNPEGEPGPHDSLYLFDRFAEMLTTKRRKWLGFI